MPQYKLCSYGQAVVDLLIHIDDQELAAFGLQKGERILVSSSEQAQLLQKLKERPLVTCGGASAANTTALYAALGGSAAFVCSVGSDRNGPLFKEEMIRAGVAMHCAEDLQHPTATSLVLFSPDGTRTMLTHLGAGAQSTAWSNFTCQSEWSLWEGYLLCTFPEIVIPLIKQDFDNNLKVVITLSDPALVSANKNVFLSVASEAYMLVGNERELLALADTTVFENAIHGILRDKNLVITKGERGSFVRFNDQIVRAAALPSRVIETTGAGDAFLGALLFGLSHGIHLESSVKIGSLMGARAVSQIGGRLKLEAGEDWDSLSKNVANK